MAENAQAKSPRTSAAPAKGGPAPNALFAGLLAWVIPGAGHLYLRRRPRALAFAAIVIAATVAGCWLQGRIYWPLPGQPLSILGTLGEAGLGAVFALLRFGLRLTGDPAASGFEYGNAFLVTAGLMNYLLVLDAWDIAVGKKD